jgi:hypothetical protein
LLLLAATTRDAWCDGVEPDVRHSDVDLTFVGGHFDPVIPPAKHGRGLGRPDVVAGFEIGGGCREYDRGADLAERLQIGAVGI